MIPLNLFETYENEGIPKRYALLSTSAVERITTPPYYFEYFSTLEEAKIWFDDLQSTVGGFVVVQNPCTLIRLIDPEGITVTLFSIEVPGDFNDPL